MNIYLGADHRGYGLKEKIKDWLLEWDYTYEDMGAYGYDEKDDYTLYAEKVAVIVSGNKKSRGIVACGSGVGADIAANKIDGAYASIGKTKEQVQAGRNDDDMNILVLAADYTEEKEAKEMIKVFLETEFSEKTRYKRRLEEIKRIEKNN